jgi:acetate kinase
MHHCSEGFSADRLRELVAESRAITFDPNEAVIQFGEEGHFLGILLSGRAEVSVTHDSAKRRC